ncbi:MAG: FtsX-like permease family protein [Asgard group archaeon]|nr:FtsX-like permease family protein [Asgard group archaeon]
MLYAIKHALRGIGRRKLKNLINTIGILIGVSLLAGVQIATDSLVNAMQETVSLRYGDADIVMQKGEYIPEYFDYTVYQQLKLDWELIPVIDGIAPRITTQVIAFSLETEQTEPFVTIIGIDETLDEPFGQLIPDETYGNNEFDFSDLEIHYSGDDLLSAECIIGNLLAEDLIDFREVDGGLELRPVSQILILFPSLSGLLDTETLNVKGIAKVEGKGVINTGYVIFMKLSHLQAVFGLPSTAINNVIFSTSKGNENAAYVKNLITDRLVYHYGEVGNTYQIDPQKLEAFQDIEDSIKNFRVVLYVFGSLIIISGVMLILNITLMNIDERQRSIGIMRAIGMTQRQLLVSLITESMILGGIGSLLGLGGGVLSGQGIIFLLENFLDIGSILQEIPLIIQPRGFVISFAIGLLISLLAALYPAWKASRIDIVETINEVETPQVRRKTGNWSILLGVLLIFASIAAFVISLKIETLPDWRWTIFISSILGFEFGLGFTLSRLIGSRISFNGFALAWMATGLLSVLILNPYIAKLGVDEEMALYTFLVSMLALVFGTIIFIALNLEWISNRFNDVFQQMKRMRSMGIVSMRYVGKKKTRSALTFAIFGVILTMNVFLAVFTGSFTLGFDDFAVREEGGVNIIAYSPGIDLGFFNITDDPQEIIEEADPNIVRVVGMKFKLSIFPGSFANLRFSATNETTTITEELPVPSDMWGINEEFLDLTEYPFESVWDGITGDPWLAAMDNTSNYVILPNLLQEFEFDEGGKTYTLDVELGSNISLPESVDPYTQEVTLSNYTVIAFVETTSYSMLFSSYLFVSEGSRIFQNITEPTAYLVQTNPRLSTEENLEVSRNIEADLLGYDTLCLRDRMEQFMEIITQSVSFMQAFVSLGLVVGVLGLIVVSLRGVTERTREIGMMRALGFQRSEVITAVVVEIFAVAFVGLVIGFANGFILGYGMYTQYLIDFDFRFIIPWATLALFTFVTIILSIIAAVLPARRASKIPPSEALRYTG